MEVTFLEGSQPLVKSFSLADGELQRSNYPLVKNFTSHTYAIRTIEQFHELITAHAAVGHCLLKGEIQRDLQKEGRAGSTRPDTDTNYLVLDADGILGIEDVEQLIHALPKEFHNTSYIAQYSASMGIFGTGLRTHLIFMLSNPVGPLVLKQYLQRLNLDIPVLRDSLRLSRTYNTLKYALDPTVAQNDKLIYIAPPHVAPGVTNTFTGERIQLVKKRQASLKLDLGKFEPATLASDTQKALNTLRKAAGLPPQRQAKERLVKGIAVIRATDQPEITGIKNERGFVYLNLNGGDSWGYYHPETDPDIIYNFKSEPNYLTSQLLPTYYAEAKAAADKAKQDYAEEMRIERIERAARNPNELQRFAYINKVNGKYYRGTYDPSTRAIEVHCAPNLFVLRNYQKLHDMDLAADLEEWDVYFDPTEDFEFNIDNHRINTYSMPEILLDTQPAPQLPPLIERIIRHLTVDEETYVGFVNWLAYIIQNRNKTGVAWVLQGTYGIGKGLLFNYVLQKLIGYEYTPRMDMDALVNDQFNGYLRNGILGLIDEADLDAMDKKRKINKKMKEIITEPTLSIREMQTAAMKIASYINILIFANEKHSAIIMPGDRRYSVAPRQNTPLEISLEEIEELKSGEHLQQCADFFMHYEVDENAATKPLDNHARRFIQRLSMDVNTEVFNAFHQGDFGYLLENLPEIERPDILQDRTNRYLPTYRQALIEIYHNRAIGTVSRDAIETIMWYATNIAQPSPNKFTKWLAHHDLEVEPLKVNGVLKRGIRVNKWEISAEQEAEVFRLIGIEEDKMKNVTRIRGTR